MKKIITISLLTLALNATAGWGGNNNPWGNNSFNNGPWGGSNNNNGIFGYNPYSMFTPDWFSEEMDDMMDEFDSNNSGPWGNRGFSNNGPWGNQGFNNSPWNNSNFGNSPWRNQASPWNNNTWKNSPWRNYGYNRVIPTTADTSAK
ncbi:MAG: hypothetical protein ABGX53_05705 [Candidatus Thioglobus sp.]